MRNNLNNEKFMEQIEILKILALPVSIVFSGLWISTAINKLTKSLSFSPTDNYEIALRLTQAIHSVPNIESQAERSKVEKEFLETYQRVLQKAEDIDYSENEST